MSNRTGFLILEGPDCTGKTTLCENIIKTVGKENCTYLHAKYPYENTNDVWIYHRRILEQGFSKSGLQKLVILDRLWPSELVYGKIHRKGCQRPGYDIMIDRLIRRVSGVYIFSLFSLDQSEYVDHISLKMKQGRAELYGSKHAKVHAEYLELYKKMQDRKDTVIYLRRDWSRIDRFIEEILIRLDCHIGQQLPLVCVENDENFVGHSDMADVLFIGEKVNGNRYKEKWPFVDLGGCSSYMAEELALAGIADHRTAFTNVGEPGWEKAFDHFFQKNKLIILMGKTAYEHVQKHYHSPSQIQYDVDVNSEKRQNKTCVKLSMRNRVWMIDHPQFYRRFWYHEHLLAKTLVKIMEITKLQKGII